MTVPTMEIAAPNSSLMMSHSTYHRKWAPNLANVGHALMKSETMMPTSATSTNSEKVCVRRWKMASCRRCFLATATMEALGRSVADAVVRVGFMVAAAGIRAP
jgi:hypothetical protein